MGANFPWVSGTAMLLSFITFWCAVCPGLAGSAPLATTNLPLSLIPATHAPSPFGGIPARHEPNGWSEARVEQDVQGGGVRVEQDVQARTEVGGGGGHRSFSPLWNNFARWRGALPADDTKAKWKIEKNTQPTLI